METRYSWKVSGGLSWKDSCVQRRQGQQQHSSIGGLGTFPWIGPQGRNVVISVGVGIGKGGQWEQGKDGAVASAH